ncbi:hypothetical protein ACMG4H_14145 [Corynebacterium glutamicum]|uniref:hypothetical protein n=1 Tax=Corynebacterium glutamicum TaxID=1718 RepID=UPI003C7C5D58
MAEKKNIKDVANVVENEVAESQGEVATIETGGKGVAKREPSLENGVYTEYDVQLVNGVKIPVSVIVDEMKLPATFGSLISEGNGAAMVIAQLTAGTRRIIDLAGATMEDINATFPEIIQRARDAADVAKAK